MKAASTVNITGYIFQKILLIDDLRQLYDPTLSVETEWKIVVLTHIYQTVNYIFFMQNHFFFRNLLKTKIFILSSHCNARFYS